jgi:hypothetical protein
MQCGHELPIKEFYFSHAHSLKKITNFKLTFNHPCGPHEQQLACKEASAQ